MKGIAVILMIQVHIVQLLSQQDIFESALCSFSLFLGGPFVAPVFLLLMGYFAALSNSGFKKNIIRGIFILFLGIGLNIFLNGRKVKIKLNIC